MSAFTAADSAVDGGPAWVPLAYECFESRLAIQGLSARWGDVLFVGTRHDGKPVTGPELALGFDQGRSGYRFVDLSIGD